MTTISDSKKKQTIYGPGGISVVLDSREIYPEDPGNGTPAIVKCEGHSGTFWCAADNGELDCGDFQLSDAQCKWLHDLYDGVNGWLETQTNLIESNA